MSVLFISFFTKYNSHTVARVLVWSKLFQSLDVPENSNKNRVSSLPSIDLDSRQKEKGLVKIIHTSSKGNTFEEGNFCWRSRIKLLETHSKVKIIPCILYGPPLLAWLGQATRVLVPISEKSTKKRERAGISRSSESW